ncbi:pyridoxine/pyridoxamine 5'-phosphate oxidase [Arthrobacter sp. Sr24]
MQTRREETQAVPSIIGQETDFAWSSAPEVPHELFLHWRRDAINAGLTDAYAATLSTVDADGMPDARVITVKDVSGDCGFKIATGDDSTKGRQLVANPNCALTFYWSPLARAVRVRGVAQRASAAESAADFLARHPQTRAYVLAAPQSSPFSTDSDRDELIRHAQTAMELDPGLFSPQWTVWTVVPESVEFWQGDPNRNHQRLSYVRSKTAWDKQRLWP